MKTAFTTKLSEKFAASVAATALVSATLIATALSASGTSHASQHDSAPLAVQQLDTIVVTAPRMHTATMPTMTVTASRIVAVQTAQRSSTDTAL